MKAIRIDNFDDFIEKYRMLFPITVVSRIDDYTNRTWCNENLGPDALQEDDDASTCYWFHPEHRWTWMYGEDGREFLFFEEKAAMEFKLRFG